MSSHFEDEMNAFFKFSVVSVFLVPNYRPVGLPNSGENKALREEKNLFALHKMAIFSLQEIPVSVNQSRISLRSRRESWRERGFGRGAAKPRGE